MKYVTEFRDAHLVKGVIDEISRTVARPWVLMEICGGQTHSIVRHGLDQLLPPQIELVHGPGCPVCDAVGADRPRPGDCLPPGRDFHLLWRYVARPGFEP